MQDSFETNHVTDYDLAKTIRKLFILNDVIATTNYDRLIEEAADVGSLTYEQPDLVFELLKYKKMKSAPPFELPYDPPQPRSLLSPSSFFIITIPAHFSAHVAYLLAYTIAQSEIKQIASKKHPNLDAFW